MSTQQGSVSLLHDPVAERLLRSAIPARLAYTWTDGTPRVVPIWFYWTGENFYLWTPMNAPKMKAFGENTKVALTIDSEPWPAKVLLVRGTAHVDMEEPASPEYVEMTKRYLGEEQSAGWVVQYSRMFDRVARITVTPEWAGILDMEMRFPSAFEQAMTAA